jgi:hypothetical protein
MTFLEQFDQDIANHNFMDCVYYLFSGNDAKMIQRIRKHTGLTNFFIFCDSYKRPSKPKVNSETNMVNALLKCGYFIKSNNKYYLEEIIDLKLFESSMKKKYGANYTSHLAARTYRVRPFLQRYILKYNNTEVLLYYIVYEPLTFLELLCILKEKVESKLSLGLIIKEFDYWFGAADLLQPNRKLINRINPAFIISPKKYWYSNEHGTSFFKNWTKDFASPVPIDEELVIGHKKEFNRQKENDFKDYRTMIDVGMID